MSAAREACPTPSAHVVDVAGGRGKTVALTFDDGPGVWTGQVLEVLRRRHVKATFFLVGKHVDMDPEQARQIAAAGMWIGNHTYHHPQKAKQPQPPEYMNTRNANFADLPGWLQAQEMDAASAAIERAAGRRPCLFRGPGGSHRATTTVNLARARGMTVVGWSNDTLDWHQPQHADRRYQDLIVRRATSGVGHHALGPHVVVLMHEASGRQIAGTPLYRGNSVVALDRIITWYQRHGYRFVSPTGQS